MEHVQILIDAGADVNSRNDAGRTPLHWAAETENCGVVELLLKVGADVTVEADDGALTAWDLMCLAAEKPWYQKRERADDEEEETEKATRVREELKKAMVAQSMKQQAAKARTSEGSVVS